MTPLLPWHDTPACKRPGCGNPMVPVADMPNGYAGPAGSRIACVACGHARVGSTEDAYRARRAASAWGMVLDGLVHEDRACARCGWVLAVERERLCPDCVAADSRERQGVLL